MLLHQLKLGHIETVRDAMPTSIHEYQHNNMGNEIPSPSTTACLLSHLTQSSALDDSRKL